MLAGEPSHRRTTRLHRNSGRIHRASEAPDRLPALDLLICSVLAHRHHPVPPRARTRDRGIEVLPQYASSSSTSTTEGLECCRHTGSGVKHGVQDVAVRTA